MGFGPDFPMNITELARRLKVPTQMLKDELPRLGFDIGRRAIKIDDAVAEKVVRVWKEREQKRQESQYKVVERKLGQGAGDKSGARTVELPLILSPREFAAKLNLPVTTVIGELFKNGVMANINERIDFETASIIAEDLGFTPVVAKEEAVDEAEGLRATQLSKLLESSSGQRVIRPPVAVVMGHVDHGKTTLLDAIRSANVAAGESGAITQHIGAYQVETKGRKITFLDTPGHEAFSAMRARGGRLADVAIIVVAANDGLQPQTLEAIEIAQREQMPFLFAINKVDREDADIERVKKSLAELNLLPEDWGGKTICVPISAKQKQNLTELLDMVLLLADLEKLEADSSVPAVGTIIEAHLDKGEGPVATALVQNGTLRPGDYVVAGDVAGKVRGLRDFLGRVVQAADPSMPVRMLGLKAVPRAGEILRAVLDEREVREVLRKSPRYRPQVRPAAVASAGDSGEEGAQLPTLNVVLKTDVLGSREAISSSLIELTKGAEIRVKVVRTALGSINDTDVTMAEASQAIVLGFNVPIVPSAESLARTKGVFVGTYKVIYDLLDEVRARANSLLKPELVRNQLGEMVVLKVFRRGKKDMIVGCRVSRGSVRAKTKARVLRNGQEVAELQVTSVRLGKEEVGEVVEGGECGLMVQGDPVVNEGDTIEVYHEEVRRRSIG